MKRYINNLIILIITGFIFWGCGSSGNYKQERENLASESDEDIIIGAVAAWDLEKSNMIKEGLELALEKINSSNGIKGRKIKIVYKDDEGNLDKGLVHAKAFCSNPEIVSVLGHSYSYVSIPCSALYQFYGLPLLSPTSDNPELSARSGYDYVMQISPVSYNYVDKLVAYLKKARLNRVVIFSQNDLFGKNFGDYFEKTASRNGISTITRIPYSEAAPAIFFKNRLLACSYFYDFNALVVAGDAAGAIPLVNMTKKYGISVPVIGTEKFDSAGMMDVVRKTGKRVIFPSAFNVHAGNKKVEAFVSAFKSKYGVLPRSGAARWYNALIFLAEAMRKAEKVSPAKIIKSIKSIKIWNGVLGTLHFESRNYLKIVRDQIVINTIDSNGQVRNATTDDTKEMAKEPIKGNKK